MKKQPYVDIGNQKKQPSTIEKSEFDARTSGEHFDYLGSHNEGQTTKKSIQTIDAIDESSSVNSKKKVKYLPKIILGSQKNSAIGNAIKEENQVTIIANKADLESLPQINDGRNGVTLPQIKVLNQSYDGITTGVVDKAMMLQMYASSQMSNDSYIQQMN